MEEATKKRGRTAAQDKYDEKNSEVISFKTKKGARAKLKEAAQAKNMPMNGFIRSALNEAVEAAIGEPMEPKKTSEKTE